MARSIPRRGRRGRASARAARSRSPHVTRSRCGRAHRERRPSRSMAPRSGRSASPGWPRPGCSRRRRRLPERNDDNVADDPLADLTALAGRVGGLSASRGVTLATVESCTGGLVGHLITEIPGSSAYYLGGFVTYSDAQKRDAVGVGEDVLEAHGAVSAQVAMAMAIGGRARTGADVAVSVTGIAGPDGGTAQKPVGLTYVAVAAIDGTEVRRFVWDGD